jgi:hypothetical protein
MSLYEESVYTTQRAEFGSIRKTNPCLLYTDILNEEIALGEILTGSKANELRNVGALTCKIVCK